MVLAPPTINIYDALEDLGFYAYSGEDGDLYRKHGLKGWRISVYWGSSVSIQRRSGYRDWETVRHYGGYEYNEAEIKAAIQDVKTLIEKGRLD